MRWFLPGARVLVERSITMDQTVGNEMTEISGFIFQRDSTALTLGKVVE
jgi:hypothetical protein